MKSGARTIGFNTPMPASTQRLHLSTKVGDSKAAIRRCQHVAIGHDRIRCIDWNMQVIALKIGGVRKLVPVSGHWSTLGRNGYDRFINSKGHVQKLTRAQQRWTTQHFVDLHGGTVEALHRLRRANGDYPLTWEESVTYAKAHGVVLTPELKSQAFGRLDVTKPMVDFARKHDYPVWTMALLKMKGCRAKCQSIRKAGGQFAVIFGNFRYMAKRKPRDWAQWNPKPNQIWGPAIARRWLR